MKKKKYKNNSQHQKIIPILNNTSVRKALEKLQHDFVVARIDNATNNVSFTCKRSFATTLFKEFGIIGTPAKTCKLISDYNNNILIQFNS